MASVGFMSAKIHVQQRELKEKMKSSFGRKDTKEQKTSPAGHGKKMRMSNSKVLPETTTEWKKTSCSATAMI